MATPGEKRQHRDTAEAVRARMRAAFDKSGMTQEQIGLKMGFTKDGARSAVSRLLNADSYDPRLSTLVAFANAVGKPLKDLA
jgi:transcriptional regulator with XRE-family HTH domain